MASIGGLSSTTTTEIRGYGGLASGLDRDTLIEQLTSGTQAKIDAANQDKTKLQWVQEAIRNITDKMYDFTQKYTSYTSSSNLLGSAFFNRTDIAVNGANSKYVAVTGSTQTSDLMSVLGVKQLAQKANLTTTTNVSDRTLTLGSLSTNLEDTTEVNVAGGQSIYLKYGNTSYTVKLGRGDDYSYDTPEGVAEAINKSLKEVSLGDGKTLADVMKVSANADGLLEIKNTDAAGNTITLSGGTGNILDVLGFSDLSDEASQIGFGKMLTASTGNTAIQKKSILSQLSGQSISFEYNGTIKWIEMPGSGDLENNTLQDLQEYLQKELNSAFGNGRIKVDLTTSLDDSTGTLSFSTTLPTTGADGKLVPGAEDTTSTLAITASTGNLTGGGSLLGIMDGESNRLNLSASLSEAGLRNPFAGSQPATLVINGKTIEGITANSTIQEIIDAVNNDPDAGVTMTYQKNTDRFVLTANQNGASGQVVVSGNVAEALFGKEGTDYTVTKGKDAIIAVKYAGSDEVTEIVRDSNTVSMDGLSITVNGTFGYDENGRIEDTEAVTFTAKVDTEKAIEAIKGMVNDFNEILKLVNTEVSTKPNRDYHPLTSSQKAEMSEDEIKLWEKEAKKGLLFMDTDIRGLADALRFALPSSLRSQLEAIGITTSTDYSENGKLTIDESKLKAALEADPESVRQLFTASAQTNADGTTTQGGLMTNIKTIMDRYASTTGATKGILIRRAGSEHSVTSVLNNSLLDQMNEIDDKISRLTTQLTTEQDRYISQFTQLEMLISQMNSQSSWLTSMMG